MNVHGCKDSSIGRYSTYLCIYGVGSAIGDVIPGSTVRRLNVKTKHQSPHLESPHLDSEIFLFVGLRLSARYIQNRATVVKGKM